MSTLRLLLATVTALVVLPLSSALAAPPNDSRSNPVTVNPNGQMIAATTAGATVDDQDHEAPGTGTHSLWYQWTAPSSGKVTITTASSAFDPVVATYTDGSDCCPFREDHDSGTGDDATVSFYVNAGRHYEILVDGEDATQFGQFTLTVALDSTPPEPFNDDFGLADNLGTGTSAYRAEVNGLFASEETLEPNHRGVSTSHSLWYRWTPAASGGARVHVECAFDGDFYGTQDPIVAVYTGSSVTGLSQVAYTDTQWLYSCDRDYVQFHAQAGVTYRIAVDAGAGRIGESGPLSLSQDTTTPTAAFDAVATYGPNQVVKFTTSESSKSQCRLDGGVITNCYADEFKLSNAAAGGHKLEVRPIDYYGNVGSWVSKTFTVNATPPQTQITGGPAALSNKSDSTFTFTSSKAGSKFECRYPTKAWFDCGTTGSYVYKWYFTKSDAASFEVRALDALGNVDPTPSGWAWTHDFAAPKVTFPYQSPNVASGQPMIFSWSTSEDAKLECSIDNGPYVACASPYTVPGKTAAGNRTLMVRATDKAGNVGGGQRTGYQQGPKPTSTTTPSTTSVRPTTPATTPTYPGRTGTGTGTSAATTRATIALAVARRSISRRTLAARGLRFSASCSSGCSMRVRLIGGRTVLAAKTVRGGGTLKLGAAGRRALKALRKGSSLTLVASGPGASRRERIRITG